MVRGVQTAGYQFEVRQICSVRTWANPFPPAHGSVTSNGESNARREVAYHKPITHIARPADRVNLVSCSQSTVTGLL